MAYTLAEAAKAVHRDKTTLLRAIKSGKLSAVRDAATGGWLIEPAELHRVYPAVIDAAMDAAANAALRSSDAEVEIRELRARLDDKDDQIADLRRRLDAEAEERRRLTALIADRSTAPAVLHLGPEPPRRSWWPWRRA